jgi:hypothetical protein
MREIPSRSPTLRVIFDYEFAEQHYAKFLRELGGGIADGGIRYCEDRIDALEKGLEAFIVCSMGATLARSSPEGSLATQAMRYGQFGV